jgi:hypothetical protein
MARLFRKRQAKEEIMNRTLILVGLLFGLTAGVAQAQTRVGVSLSFGEPSFAGHVVIGHPYYPHYAHPYYYRSRSYYRPPVIIVEEPRWVVVRGHRHYARRYHRGW